MKIFNDAKSKERVDIESSKYHKLGYGIGWSHSLGGWVVYFNNDEISNFPQVRGNNQVYVNIDVIKVWIEKCKSHQREIKLNQIL